MTDWLAMTVANVASTTSGRFIQCGASRKNGFSTAVLSASTSAPWPK